MAQSVAQFNLMGSYKFRFNLMRSQMISNFDIFGLITYFVIVCDINIDLIVQNMAAPALWSLCESSVFVNNIHSFVTSQRAI
jgi:hypothetical protein